MVENNILSPLTEEDIITEKYMLDHRKKYQEWFSRNIRYGMIDDKKLGSL